MRLAPIRYCGKLRYATRDCFTVNRSLLAGAPAQVLKLVQRYKSDKKASGTDCCKEADQTANKRVDCWPTNRELQPPPNYDPYHIKVPKVAVPSLPPTDAKRAAVLLTSGERDGYQRGCPGCEQAPHEQPASHQREASDEEQDAQQRGVSGWLGKWKKFFRRGNKDSSDSFARDPLPATH